MQKKKKNNTATKEFLHRIPSNFTAGNYFTQTLVRPTRFITITPISKSQSPTIISRFNPPFILPHGHFLRLFLLRLSSSVRTIIIIASVVKSSQSVLCSHVLWWNSQLPWPRPPSPIFLSRTPKALKMLMIGSLLLRPSFHPESEEK